MIERFAIVLAVLLATAAVRAEECPTDVPDDDVARRALAKQLGVDGRRLRAALDDHRHARIVDQDLAAASKADIVQVPTVLVNDYMVGGVEPAQTYERLIQRALDER